jgi:hypothetical protein
MSSEPTRRVASPLVLGSLAAFAVLAVAGSAHAQQRQWFHRGELDDQTLGASVAWVPDVDGDGVVDLLVGAPNPDLNYAVEGRAYLYSGATHAKLREFDGTANGDLFGSIVADLGDVDGDGVRDFAFAAPVTTTPAVDVGSIEVRSGTGTTIRTIVTSFAFGHVGLAMSWLGDVDGDGVRDLLYNDFDVVAKKYTAFVVSGKTGATIRKHSSAGVNVGRFGDADADGVDDYVVCDSAHAKLYSGKTGSLLFSIATTATDRVGPAGDVDLDGAADVLLTNLDRGPVHVYSGKTGKLLYDLALPTGTRNWTAAGATGDVDGDGHPDLVAARFDARTPADELHVFSGANGSQLSVHTYAVNAAFETLDATADLDGDGVFDVLAGAPDANASSSSDQLGQVDVLSGADGSTLATIDGCVFGSDLGADLAVVGDRDGDGWRDVAVLAPFGLACGDPSNVVQVVSGRDGHELSRFQTAAALDDQHFERELAAVGDLDGDGLAELAVVPPSPNPIELHSGADDSLLATIATSGDPSRLAPATDVDGTPLLGTIVHGSTSIEADVFDLTSGALTTRFSYANADLFDLSCLGDVNGDGTVDWVVSDPIAYSFGAVTAFAGGSTSHSSILWSAHGTSTSPVFRAASTGDLNGDGVDDVLVVNGRQRTVTALSGVDGSQVYQLTMPLAGNPYSYVFTSVAPLGDVDRDGVCDFACGAAAYNDYYHYDFDVKFLVFSGRTGTLLFRFDSADAASDGRIAHQGWHDDPRLDSDRVPDLVVATSSFVGAVEAGRVDAYRLDDLMLQVDPASPVAGSTVSATAADGPPGSLVGLYAVDLSTTQLGYFLALDVFDPNGVFTVSDVVPASMRGLTLDVISYAVGFNGKLVDSEKTAIDVQ